MKPSKICPNCHKEYTPALDLPEPDDQRSIQDIYPDAKPFEREQLMTGICSDECWDAFLGTEAEWKE